MSIIQLYYLSLVVALSFIVVYTHDEDHEGSAQPEAEGNPAPTVNGNILALFVSILAYLLLK